jgi:hypothetical protein
MLDEHRVRPDPIVGHHLEVACPRRTHPVPTTRKAMTQRIDKRVTIGHQLRHPIDVVTIDLADEFPNNAFRAPGSTSIAARLALGHHVNPSSAV